ncbi:MAG: two-component regulator propeller domain-containing protein [Bacteroidia bacterium]|nr:two-component regulator propeller domain-containing protein [Bacteroidia bacterium]
MAAARGQTLPRSGYQFVHLDGSKGLSSNTVHDVIEDRLGFIWIATRYGLNRFDGYACIDYRPAALAQAAAGNRVYALHEDPHGRIWTAYRDGGIWILDPRSDTFSLYRSAALPEFDWEHLTARCFYQDRQGRLWIGTNGHGAMVLDPQQELAFRLGNWEAPQRQLSNNFVLDFAEDADGNIWIATAGPGLNVWQAASGQTRQIHAPDPRMRDLESFGKSLCWDPGGWLWIGTEGNGLFRYHPESRHFTHYPYPGGPLSSALITGLLRMPDSTLWISTDGGGLNVLDPRTGRCEWVQHQPGSDQSLNTNALYTLFQDRRGRIWIGTFNGGLNLLTGQRPAIRHLKPRNPEQPAGSRSILSLARQDAERIWAGTDGGGLLSLHLGSGEAAYYTTRNSGIGGDVITSIQPAGDGSLWLGTFASGLARFSPQRRSGSVFRHDPSRPETLLSNHVWDMLPDPDGGLWLAMLGGGLHYLPPGSSSVRRFIPQPSQPNSVPDWNLMDLLRTRDGQIWIAAETQGLCSYDPHTDRFTRYRHDPADPASLGSDHLRCLFEDREGRLWIGTEGKGLSCLLPGESRFRHLTPADGLPSGLIEAIQQDLSGRIWVSTHRGVACIGSPEGPVRAFTQEDGLPGSPFNPKAALRLGTGLLLFGGVDGITVIDPERTEPAPPLPPVVLTGFRIFSEQAAGGRYQGRQIWSGSLNDSSTVVEITYRENAFSFEFSGIDPAAPGSLRYAWRLRGFSDQWQHTGASQRSASFTNLEPGLYRFEVRAAHAYGSWSPVRSIGLRIWPPFWKTVWFQALMTLLALGAVLGAVRYLLYRQAERSRKRLDAAEREILRLTNEKLAQEIAGKQERLSALLLQTAHKNELLNRMRETILGSSGFAELRHKLLSAIQLELREADYWDQFQLSFDESHQEFIRLLRQRHPGLSAGEIRLACFIRMRLGNREIASVLNITLSGVEKGKVRLKHKLGLPREADLNAYLIDMQADG